MDPRTNDRVLQAAAQVTVRDERQAAVLGGVVQSLLTRRPFDPHCAARAADLSLGSGRAMARELAGFFGSSNSPESLQDPRPVGLGEVAAACELWKQQYEGPQLA